MVAGSLRPAWVVLLSFCLCAGLAVFPQSQIQVGYALLSADPGTYVPVATALFTCTNSQGILISQAGVAATEPMLSGRIFVDQDGTETGVAFVNPSQVKADVTLILRDLSGAEVDQQNLPLDPGNHIARFVSQLFTNLPAGFSGTLTFVSAQKLGAITLRLTKNLQNEDLYTTLPVIDLSSPTSNELLFFPQIAAGGGYSTQLILINKTAQSLRGRVSLIGDDGNPLVLQTSGQESSQFSYDIPPHGAHRAELGRPGDVRAGYAVVTPDPGQITPDGTAVFAFRQGDNTVTEAGVGASPATTAARIFVDNVDSYTGVAIANPAAQPVDATFVLLDRNGSTLGSVSRALPARGHLAIFAHELFPGLSNSFTGVMEIRSPSAIVPITLKLTTNARSDSILTTLPVADLNRPATATSVVFAQIAIGGTFSTRLIFINAYDTTAATGRLSFLNSNSTAMTVPLAGKTDSQFGYQVTAGGGEQYRPGSSPSIASISLLDPQTNKVTGEVTVNVGNVVKIPLLVLDEGGSQRSDFPLSYSSLNPDVATIDANGNVTGKKEGFSTLTVSSGGVVTAGTITVVKIDSGVAGYQISGIVQDLANRLYLADTGNHTVLLSQNLARAPEIYAGVKATAGFKNEDRLKSLFREPGFLAFDQARGTMYVSDGENHAIRKVQPGPDGKVETYTGTGDKGSTDGALSGARFNHPLGVVLDNRGYLWVVDSGNHTIRRINLAKATIETIAGKTGAAGWLDGKGGAARFSAPVGIAVETESLVKQQERERKGDPPPPVSVIVADTGNGVLRRVKETGEVETIRGEASSSPGGSSSAPSAHVNQPVLLSSPTGVAVDPFGNIYVSEPDRQRVSVILPNGEAVAASQSQTFQKPIGLASAQGGIVVADGWNSASKISYGEPQIISIVPSKITLQGGEKVTIRGRNFSAETIVILGGAVMTLSRQDTQSLEFTAPPQLPSGLTTLTIQNRAGLTQSEFLVEPVRLSDLPPGHITTVAGGTTFAQDGSLAVRADLSQPSAVAMDPAGNIYIADENNHRIRRVSADTGIITTVAGTGEAGGPGDTSGNNGPATAAKLVKPCGVVVDASGNLYISEWDGYRVSRVAADTGVLHHRGRRGPSTRRSRRQRPGNRGERVPASRTGPRLRGQPADRRYRQPSGPQGIGNHGDYHHGGGFSSGIPGGWRPCHSRQASEPGGHRVGCRRESLHYGHFQPSPPKGRCGIRRHSDDRRNRTQRLLGRWKARNHGASELSQGPRS